MTTLTFSKTIFAGVFTVMLMFTGCSGTEPEKKTDSISVEEGPRLHTTESLQKEISELEGSLENPNLPNRIAVSKQLIEYYEDYTNMFSNDKLAPEMLFKAGNQAVNIEEYDLALKEYNLVEEYYRNYLKRPEVLFLQAFVYETYKNEYGKAKERYEKLIKQYPDHELAVQAKESLKYMGISDEERIRQFEKKN